MADSSMPGCSAGAWGPVVSTCGVAEKHGIELDHILRLPLLPLGGIVGFALTAWKSGDPGGAVGEMMKEAVDGVSPAMESA